MAMRVLIQNCNTFHYLTDTLGWCLSPQEALGFQTSTRALDHCLKHRLENVQIVLKFERDDLDVHLPLRSSGCLN